MLFYLILFLFFYFFIFFRSIQNNIMKKKTDKPIESVDDYLVGEIVLYFKQPFWNPSCGIFARIAQPPTDKTVVLYCNPTGEETRVVNKSEILPIHPQLLPLFQDSRSAQNLVHDPISDLFQSITDHVKEQYVYFPPSRFPIPSKSFFYSEQPIS